MTTISESLMQEVHARLMAAVMRSVAAGVPVPEACERHMQAIESEWPLIATAYKAWAATRAAK